MKTKKRSKTKIDINKKYESIFKKELPLFENVKIQKQMVNILSDMSDDKIARILKISEKEVKELRNISSM